MRYETTLLRSALVTAIAAGMLFSTMGSSLAARPADVTINGAGSTFDQPLFNSQFSAYENDNPNVDLNYQGVGSGAGQADLNNRTVDFGAWDVPEKKTDGFTDYSNVVQFPVTLGGVSMIANLPDYNGELKLSGNLIAQIYMGQITQWSDPKLLKIDPNLANLSGNEDNITVVHRQDSSGTSYIFTDFLSKTNKTWKSTYGASKSPAWPVGVGGTKSTGVDGIVDSTVGAIGYVESTYAIENQHNGVLWASVQSKSGTYLQPLLDYIANDAAEKAKVTSGSFSITYLDGAASYPISGYSWVGVYKKGNEYRDWVPGSKMNPGSSAICSAATALFDWQTSNDGQSYGPPLNYVPLPSQPQSYAASQLARVSCGK
jgi:phosphate transport system substrate-binding protein